MDKITDELDLVDLGDQRVNERAKQILDKLFQGAGTGLCASLSIDNEIKAAYRWFDNDLVVPEHLLEPHFNKTLERIKEHKIVGLVQDTTDIDMKHMEHVENLGVINDTARPGCTLHPLIAFTPEKLCLGVLDVKFLVRDPEELGKKASNNSRDIESKESFRWIQGYEIACEIAEKCPETLCVCIGDRESDIYELFLKKGKAHFLARAWHDRGTEIAKSEESLELIEENNKLKDENKELAILNEKLRKQRNSKNIPEIVEARKKNSEKIAANRNQIKENTSTIRSQNFSECKFKHQLHQSPIVGTIQFNLPKRDGKVSRVVTQTVRAKTITLLPSRHKSHLSKVEVNAVLLEEENPPEGEEPLIWMFLTSLPIDTLEDIQLIIDLYLSRWGIEIFFKVLKSGCKIEELRLKEASRLFACISLYLIVSWRILYTTFIGRVCPELPCTVLFDIDEWQSVYATTMKARPPSEPPNLAQFLKMVATLGGYRGRKSDGPPGIKVMWVGMQAVHNLAEGWRAHKEYG